MDPIHLFNIQSEHVISWSVKEFTKYNMTIALKLDEMVKNDTEVMLIVKENNLFKSIKTN